MNRNNNVRTYALRFPMFLGVLSIFVSLFFTGCDNSLVEAVKAIQAETVSPRIVLSLGDNNVLVSGTVIDFDQTPMGSTAHIELTIENHGRTNLNIDLAAITISMDSGTEPETFTFKSLPPTIINSEKSGTCTLSFSPTVSIGNKSATISIPTNDITIPLFTLKVTGSSTMIPANLSAAAANHQVTLNWQSVPAATGYNIYSSTTTSAMTLDATTLLTTVSSETSYVHSGLANKTTHHYAVTAVGANGESQASSPVSATPIQLVLYVMQNASKNSNVGIKSYTINSSDGSLTPIPGSLAKAGDNNLNYVYSSITVDPFTKYAYITDKLYTGGAGLVYTCKIDPITGALSFPGAGYTAATANSNADEIAVTPSGKFAYVLNSPGSNAGIVNAYTINGTTGTLTPVSEYTPLTTGGIQSNGIAIDPLGEFVYVVSNNGGAAGTITGFSIDPVSGILTETAWVVTGTNTANTYTPGVPYKGSNSISFSPTGKFYVGEWTSDFVEAYRRPDTNGLPVALGRYGPVSVNSSEIIVDPRGRFLYSYSYTNDPHYIAAFKIMTDGTLSPVVNLYNIEQGTIKYPMGFVVDPTGCFLYVLLSENTGTYIGEILIYRIDQSTGALTLESINSTIGKDPKAIAVGSLP